MGGATAGQPADRVSGLCRELAARGERVTAARRDVIEILVDSPEHLTAEEIYERSRRRNPEVHRATVYRTLETLAATGLVEHSHLGHGPAVYHLTADVHQHLVCEGCGHVMEVPATLLQALDRKLRADYGFVMRPAHFAIVGLCEECAGYLPSA